MTVVPAPLDVGPLRLTHTPNWSDAQPTLAGHLHPKCRIVSRTEDLRLPCFLLREQTLVLPAFGSFVDGQLIKRERERVFVVADDVVLEVNQSTYASAR